MICDCAGVLFTEGDHDAGCPALVAAPEVGPQARGADQTERVNLPVSDKLMLATLRKLIEYKTTPWDCGCPDYQYRRRPKLQSCKHMRLYRELEPHLEAMKIMPIKGMTYDRAGMLPRIGKIRLGRKQKHSNGNTYPVQTPHFVLDDAPEVEAVYGKDPTALTVILPTLDLDVIAPSWYKAYQQSRDWVCKGDGEKAMRKMNPERVEQLDDGTVWGPLPAPRDEKIELFTNVKCLGRDCPDYGHGDCSEVMNLQFLMLDVDGSGVWQIDTGSFHGITGFYDSVRYLEIIGNLMGVNFAGVPLKLEVVPKDVTPFGKKITIHHLRLSHEDKMENVLQAANRPKIALGPGVMPDPDETADEMLNARNYAPEGVVPLPDDEDHSNAANLRRANAGVPPHNAATGEINQQLPPSPEQGRTFEAALAECGTAAEYTALLQNVYERFKPSDQKADWMDQITAAAEEAGYIADKLNVVYTDPQVREVDEVAPADEEVSSDETEATTDAAASDPVDPADEDTPAPVSALDADDEQEEVDSQPTVICAGPCGEEVELAQVNADGICNLCVNQAMLAVNATNEPEHEPEATAAPLF